MRTAGVDAFGNDASVVVEFEQSGFRSVFLGDLGEEAQDALLAAGGIRPSQVVKVAHHGSGDQSAKLYERISATLGVISVGIDNGYGHPAKKILDLLQQNGTGVARTDTEGLIVVGPAGHDEVEVWTEKTPDDQAETGPVGGTR